MSGEFSGNFNHICRIFCLIYLIIVWLRVSFVNYLSGVRGDVSKWVRGCVYACVYIVVRGYGVRVSVYVRILFAYFFDILITAAPVFWTLGI